MGKASLRLAGFAVAATLYAPGAAQGSTVIANYSIQGAGFVSASASTSAGACQSMILTNTGVQGCGAIVDSTGPGNAAQVTMNAAPRNKGGWFFAGWQGCPS